MNPSHPEDALRILETALICAPEPLSLSDLATLFDGAWPQNRLRELLAQLQARWADRGVVLVELPGG